MNFSAPKADARQTYEAQVAQEAQRMKWRREKAAEARKRRGAGFHDAETVLVADPPTAVECSFDDCQTKPKARGLCPKHYKRIRRLQGKAN